MEPTTAALVLAALLSVTGVIRVLASPLPGAFTDRVEVQELLAALRHLDPERTMRFTFVRPRIVVLETGVTAMPLINGRAGVELQLNRQCVTHVIVGSLGIAPRLDSTLRAAIALRPERFSLAWANQAFAVYRFTGLQPDLARIVSAGECRRVAGGASIHG